MKIILSTSNPSKAEQIRRAFRGLPVSILTLSEAGIIGEVVEDGRTLKENALKKAIFAHEKAKNGEWAMAEDTGLFIDALNGQPGNRAARWAGESASTEDITRHTLKQMEGVKRRSARFETVVALVSPDSDNYFFSGEATGQLLETPRCKSQPKMPYSGIFVYDGTGKVAAEMTVDEENKVSNRGNAFKKVRVFIEELLKKE